MSDQKKEPTGLARSGRRASISMPALDLLTQIAEYTWQTKPQVNSSFDDLTEAGLASKYRGSGQIGDKLKRGQNYDTIQSEESEGDTEYMNRSQSDFSEIESPDPETKVSGNRRARKVNMFAEIDKDEEEINAEIQPLKPLATRRKSGVVPIKIPNSNFLKSEPIDSNNTSPTPSTASMASLLRDKFSNSIPGVFRNRKPREYKIQAFVAVLFLMIILLVGSIYVIHKEKELQKSYFERIRFSSKDRKIRVTDVKGREVLTGQLGMSLTKKDKAWPCLAQHRRVNETCLEWMNKARLYFKVITPGVPHTSSYSESSPSRDVVNNLKCYGVQWESLNSEFELKDCFNIDENRGGYFYGGGEMATSQWPLNRTSFPLSEFLTGNKQKYNPELSAEEAGDLSRSFQWGSTLCRYFLNSHGAAIKIRDDVPLHVSINQKKDRMLCLAAKNGFGYDQPENGDLPELNYTICTADNILDITNHLADKAIWEGVKHEDAQLTLSLALAPIWRILPQILLNHGNQSEAALLNHTDRIAALHLSEGFILIDESWQRRIGDLEMDSRRFPTMPETFNITRRRGFKVALTISPFFSTESQNYVQGLKEATSTPSSGNGIWIGEKNGRTTKTKVPALTQYKDSSSSAVLDVTSPDARLWLEKKVTVLVEKYGIDALYVDLGNAYDFPQHYEFKNKLSSLDAYKELFLRAIRPVTNVNTIGVSGAIRLPKLPTFVALSPTESSWEGLQSVIPNILTLGVAGYPFLIPGCIGGDYFKKVKENSVSLHQNDGHTNDDSTNNNQTQNQPSLFNLTEKNMLFNGSQQSLLPDRELYIRWLELVHFLPVVQYSHLPSDYDQKVIEIATQMSANRKNKLYPYIKKAIDAVLTSGLPIIRPLWMIDPTDPNCLKVSDEFSIGGDIIVAPILRPGAIERDIYLPRGKWRDEMDGSNTKGEKWLHHYRVKEDQIPFFTKIPEGYKGFPNTF